MLSYSICVFSHIYTRGNLFPPLQTPLPPVRFWRQGIRLWLASALNQPMRSGYPRVLLRMLRKSSLQSTICAAKTCAKWRFSAQINARSRRSIPPPLNAAPDSAVRRRRPAYFSTTSSEDQASVCIWCKGPWEMFLATLDSIGNIQWTSRLYRKFCWNFARNRIKQGRRFQAVCDIRTEKGYTTTLVMQYHDTLRLAKSDR